MTQATLATATLRFLEDRWDPAVAATLDEPELCAIAPTCSAPTCASPTLPAATPAPRSWRPIRSPASRSKSLGQRLRRRPGQHQAHRLRHALPGEAARARAQLQRRRHRRRHGGDVSAVRLPQQSGAASIDTPLHGFLPFPHVDHLHPDWGIALAASANGKTKMEEFNREFNHSLVWIPWQRPGFELGLMMRDAVARQSRLRRHRPRRPRPLYLGPDPARVLPEHHHHHRPDRPVHRAPRQPKDPSASAAKPFPRAMIAQALAVEIAPYLRGRVSTQNRWISSFSDAPDVLQFVELRASRRTGLSRHQLP